MKIIRVLAFTVAFLALSLSTAHAQKNFVKDADLAYKNKQYYNAVELYKKAIPKIKKKEEKARCTYMVAECYRYLYDNKQSESWYNKAIKAKYPDPKAHLYRAEALKKAERYPDAIVEFNAYKAAVPSDPAGENGVKSSEIAQKWKDNPTRHKVENMAQINGKEGDFSPYWADKKHLSLIFTSKREGSTGGAAIDAKTGLLFSDLFETKVDKNGKWSAPVPLGGDVNTAANEGMPWLNSKGDRMYFTRCGKNKKQQVKCTIYGATKKGQSWETDKEPITFGVDSAEKWNFRHPTLSKDEQVMVFMSDWNTGDPENTDLYMSTYDKKTKTWGKAVSLGNAINTNGKEAFPYLHDDGSLYFSSTGLLGMGGFDIYKAEKKSKDKWAWTNPVNLKYPMNSAEDDFGIIFDGAKDRGYLSSNREGTKGMDDIWSFVLPPLEFSLDGVVADCKNKTPLEGVAVRITGSDGSSNEQKTDKAGYYKFKINPNVSYVVNVFADKAKSSAANPYFNLPEDQKGKMTTVDEPNSKVFKKDFCLQEILPTEIRFPEVQYDLGKATLRPESKDSLNYLVTLLTDNPTLQIELAAHTDSRGSDADNMKLSIARAKSCYDYLVLEKHINAERIKPKGYGETKLLHSDKEINALKTVQEREAMHQKNRRTVIRVLRTDFVDPNAPKTDRTIVVPKILGTQEEYGDDKGADAGDQPAVDPKSEQKAVEPKTTTTPQTAPKTVPATSPKTTPATTPKKPK
jgi:peptidoglycan-associated lipoprotein